MALFGLTPHEPTPFGTALGGILAGLDRSGMGRENYRQGMQDIMLAYEQQRKQQEAQSAREAIGQLYGGVNGPLSGVNVSGMNPEMAMKLITMGEDSNMERAKILAAMFPGYAMTESASGLFGKAFGPAFNEMAGGNIPWPERQDAELRLEMAQRKKAAAGGGGPARRKIGKPDMQDDQGNFYSWNDQTGQYEPVSGPQGLKKIGSKEEEAFDLGFGSGQPNANVGVDWRKYKAKQGPVERLFENLFKADAHK